MDPILYICLTLFLGLFPVSVIAKGGGKGGGGGKSRGSKSSSRPIIFVPATGGSRAYCRDQLTNAVVKCPSNKARNTAIIVICSVLGGILLITALCCWRRSRKRSKQSAAAVHPMNRQFTLDSHLPPAHVPAGDPAPKKAVTWLDRIALARPRQYSFPLLSKSQGKYEKVSKDEKSSPPPTQISFPTPAHHDDQSPQSGVKK